MGEGVAIEARPRSTVALPEGAVLAAALAGLGAGGVAHLFGAQRARDLAWTAATLVVLAPTLVTAARGLAQGSLRTDVIAVLSMAGALALRQSLAGAIVAVMLAGGTALERYAAARARRELTALLGRAPRVAHRKVGDRIDDVGVGAVAPGDVLVVKAGEVVPADGLLLSERAVLDASALTGEAAPLVVAMAMPVASGTTNAGAPFELRATAAAGDSTYAAILRLVEAAGASRAPLVRLADRFAGAFLFFTLAIAGGAWAWSGDALRALGVLVVATPCPLLLAAPAALVAGVSRAARHGIIVKGAAALEALARTDVVLLDKTGTITTAQPRVTSVEAFAAVRPDEIVRLAGSLEQVSVHPYAPAIVAEARDRGQRLAFPVGASEKLGLGISGSVDGRAVALGQLGWVAPGTSRPPAVRALERRMRIDGSASVYVAVDGAIAGALVLQDPLRPEAPRAIDALRKAGIDRIDMVTGDRSEIAELIGDAAGVDRVFAERMPEDKVAVVRSARSGRGSIAMVGDGVNDAAALALADVGVAMGARGATAASEAADVVLVADRLEGLVLAIRIAQRTRRIALQSALAGMAMSIAAMAFAAAGLLAPVAGAVLQEVIDLAVIANALRALGGGDLLRTPTPRQRELAHELHTAHRALHARIEELAEVAARIESAAPEEARTSLLKVRAFLLSDLLPHERAEQETAYPQLAALSGGEDPTGPLVHTHREIARRSRLFARLVDQLPPSGPGPEDLPDLQRALYGLHAILRLHFAQEEELYLLLRG